MVRRRGDSPRASDLMEPLRVTVGASETVGDAVRRLRAHQAAAAPVVRAGRTMGMITRALAENVLRHGLGDAPVSRIISGGAPRVGPSAGPAALRRASLGIAPGVVVATLRGPVLGLVTRHGLDAALNRAVGAGPLPTWLLGPSIVKKMESRLGLQRTALLRHAGGLAAVQGRSLHLVGGIVRDILAGVVGEDLDLVADRDGITFSQDLARVTGGRVIAHEAFGTAAVVLDSGIRVDVATARREIYDGPATLPRVEPGSMLDDLMRRDLTINSMAIRLDGSGYGRLVDELGGRGDLEAGKLRVHHMVSITEDPTRAFRVARFSGRFGYTATEETLCSLDLAQQAGAFARLTGERLYREFSLIARERDPAAALTACARLDLLRHLGPGLRWDAAAARRTTRLIGGLRAGLLNDSDALLDRPLLLLMVLAMTARPKELGALAQRLRIRGEAAERLVSFRSPLESLSRALSVPLRPSRLVRACENVRPEILALAWASSERRAALAVERYLERYRAVRASVTGEMLRAMGLAPGPAFQSILAELRNARLDGRVADRESEQRLALRLARHWMSGTTSTRSGPRS